ncbi:MAG: VanW family protein [Lachnospiraceae bacterium]|nr:VanW family protein [Lachnospiraceae bacterium]
MKRKRKQQIIIAVLAVIIVVVMVLSMVMPALADEPSDGKKEVYNFAGINTSDLILPGISAGGVPISGMTYDEAQAAVKEHVEARRQTELTITANGVSHSIKLVDLGYNWVNTDALDDVVYLGKSGNIIERYKFYKDVDYETIDIPLEFSAVDDAIWSFTAQLAGMADIEVMEPTLAVNDDGSFEVINGETGYYVDQEAGMNLIRNTILGQWEAPALTLEMPIIVVEPNVSNDQMAQVQDRLGSGQTDFAGSIPNRVQNITTGVSKINGTLLMPGEQFSMEQIVTPFTEENGYAMATSYSGGTSVESLGGGICQVSTTLYLALLQAELQIDERHNHSMLVGYIEPSMDAAIAEGNKDLKFTNNTDAPVYIKGWIDGTVIHFEVFGHEMRSPDRTLTYTSEVIEKKEAEVKIELDDKIELGQIHHTDYGHDGMDSRLWKTVTENGETTTDVLNSDNYEMSPIIYAIGTKGASPEAVSAIQADVTAGKDIQDVISSVAKYATPKLYVEGKAVDDGSAAN